VSRGLVGWDVGTEEKALINKNLFFYSLKQ
jgi:hypothetical protein